MHLLNKISLNGKRQLSVCRKPSDHMGFTGIAMDPQVGSVYLDKSKCKCISNPGYLVLFSIKHLFIHSFSQQVFKGHVHVLGPIPGMGPCHRMSQPQSLPFGAYHLVRQE